MAIKTLVCKMNGIQLTAGALTGSTLVIGSLTLGPGCTLEPVLVFKPRRAMWVILGRHTHQRLGEVLAAPFKELRR